MGKQGASGSSRKKVSCTLFSLLPLKFQERQNETKQQAKRSSKYSLFGYPGMHRHMHRQPDLQFYTHNPWVFHYACFFLFCKVTVALHNMFCISLCRASIINLLNYIIIPKLAFEQCNHWQNVLSLEDCF